MKLSVKLFARARDLAGTGTVSLELPDDCRVGQMKQTLAACCPDLEPLLPNLLIAVGNEYANDDVSLNSTSEVACFPPVSGG